MATAIYVEFDVVGFYILAILIWQLKKNVNQRTSRIWFAHMVYCLMITILADILWILVDGKIFTGSVVLNQISNMVYYSFAVASVGLWMNYVCTRIWEDFPRKGSAFLMAPAVFSFLLCMASMSTGWIFGINQNNYYYRGKYFWIIIGIGLAYYIASFIVILIHVLTTKNQKSKQEMAKLFVFFVLPTVGIVTELLVDEMPGPWPAAAISLAMVFMLEQNAEVLTDGLTGVNNRKLLERVFPELVNDVSEDNRLYMFMMDLDRFKTINDSFGHSVGDEALVESSMILKNIAFSKSMLTIRYGGDEFLILGFLKNDAEALEYKNDIISMFEAWNEQHARPYMLGASVGYSEYLQGWSVEEWIRHADRELYREKKRRQRNNKGEEYV